MSLELSFENGLIMSFLRCAACICVQGRSALLFEALWALKLKFEASCERAFYLWVVFAEVLCGASEPPFVFDPIPFKSYSVLILRSRKFFSILSSLHTIYGLLLCRAWWPWNLYFSLRLYTVSLLWYILHFYYKTSSFSAKLSSLSLSTIKSLV